MSEKSRIEKLLAQLRASAAVRRTPRAMREPWETEVLAETWSAAVAPFLDDNPRVRTIHNAVRNGLRIDEAFPCLVAVLVEHANAMEAHAIKLAALQPPAPIRITVRKDEFDRITKTVADDKTDGPP